MRERTPLFVGEHFTIPLRKRLDNSVLFT